MTGEDERPLRPEEITALSFRIVEAELAPYPIEDQLRPIVRRVVHSTADFEFARILCASQGAVRAGMEALRSGATVVTDVRMVQVGVRADRLAQCGAIAHCGIADEEVREEAKRTGMTRAALAMRKLKEFLPGAVVAVGNAPTALNELLRLMLEEELRPSLVIGVPVGFVGTPEAKERLAAESPAPWIISRGRKGGSPVAVAIVNELLEMAVGTVPNDRT